AVCDRVEQGLAQLKNVDSLKLSDLGFSRSPLAPDDVTSKTVLWIFSPQKITKINLFLKMMKNEVDRLIFWGEKIRKNRFRRDVVWSQRRLNMKNDYAHRHQHPREPRIWEFQRINIFELCQPHPVLNDSFANGLIFIHRYRTTTVPNYTIIGTQNTIL
ncbi:hypothetical protein PRIPAC_95471, partial [Pristionchus pacificus]|uniref:Uncharacterized protein n=1 Tax=Pristionchus pacificus TaxID=54126 RepID=A0A2A6D1D0_PRIPA